MIRLYFSRNILQILMLALLSPICHAQDLDDLTMKVIGLDEIPGGSYQIEIPEAALEDMADLNEALDSVQEPVGAILAIPGEDTSKPEQ